MGQATVIGGGFGGIAAALRLRAIGHDVTLLDRCSRLGGRAQVFERDGFRHDAGPTVITAPFLFDELFELFGKKRSDYVEFIPLDVWYRFHYHDGREFDYGGTVEDTLSAIKAFDPADCDGYRKLLDHSKRIFDVGFTELADQPFHSIGSLLRQIPAMARLGCYRTVWQLVSKYLRNDHLRRAFSIQPLLVGGNPFETTCIYSLIHYLERKWGIFFARGGTGAVVDALEKLMLEEGITIRTGTTVSSIDVKGRKASGIRLKQGDALATDLVVSNTDPLHLYSNMLPQSNQSWIFRMKQMRMKQSMGLFVLFFGTDRQYPEVAHHTIWLGKRFKELIHEIFHGENLPEDFSLYLHRPTATDSSFAPEGKDSFYVLAPVPNMKANIDWSNEGPRLRDSIVEALDKSILPGLHQSIQSDFFMTPKDFSNDYLSSYGSGFSVAPIFSQSAWFRFHNRSEALDNLYLVGAGTHPGAGVPGVLCSAKVLNRVAAA
ncbi:MAG: phytoene desaturase family protein [Verrucomicrobiota bacterium]